MKKIEAQARKKLSATKPKDNKVSGPMTPQELALVLQAGEGYLIEFKENVNTDLAKEMVAMANASGGRILIGVNDGGQVLGVRYNNSLASQIQDMAQHCDPPVAIELEPYQNIVIVHVKEGANKPYRANKGFFLRNGANAQKMTTREIRDFMQAEGRIRFDEMLRNDLKFKQVFAPELLKSFLEQTGLSVKLAPASILQNLGVLSWQGKEPILNNAGVLFFCKEMYPVLYQATITCALYKGTDKVHILDRKDFTGSLLSNIEDTLVFLKQHLRLRYEIKTLQRKEILEIPEDALREAVVNAVCHRDYFEKGCAVMIEIFDDRVMITNPGGLPKGLPKEKFGQLSVPRNPLIASLLHRSHYIEKMGTGIHRMREVLRQAGNPAPDFDIDSFFTLTLQRPSDIKWREVGAESSPESSPESSLETSPRISIMGISQTQLQILTLIQQKPTITTEEMGNAIGISKRAILKQIKALKEKHRLQRHGATKKGYWQIMEEDT